MEYSLSFLFLLFITYSFFGWLLETIVCSIQAKKIISRGFLIGPFCPIYGVAALTIVFLLNDYLNDPFALFILATFWVTFIEYITSFILEKLFKVRWWDYSHLPFNINGRIVLHNSVAFGFLGLFLIYYINPLYVNLLEKVPNNILNITAIFLFAIFIIDIGITSKILFAIRKTTTEVLKDRTEEFSILIRQRISKQIVLTKRLLNSFPNLKPIDTNKIVDQIKEYMENGKKNL